MQTWTVWSEGYVVTGGSSDAQLLGTVEAETFGDAVKLVTKDMDPDTYLRDHDGNGKWTYWGCRLFDNETDARKAFG